MDGPEGSPLALNVLPSVLASLICLFPLWAAVVEVVLLLLECFMLLDDVGWSKHHFLERGEGVGSLMLYPPQFTFVGNVYMDRLSK